MRKLIFVFVLLLASVCLAEESRYTIYNLENNKSNSLKIRENFKDLYRNKQNIRNSVTTDGNQTITGVKTFTGNNVHSGDNTLTGDNTFSGTNVHTGSTTFSGSTNFTSSEGITSTYGFYHDRGDPAEFDFNLTDLTTDGSFHDLDLSSIVPIGTKAVAFHVSILDDTVDSYIGFRKNGNSNFYNRSVLRCCVANIYSDTDMIIPCDSNRVIEYITTSTTFTAIYIVVKGWWK